MFSYAVGANSVAACLQTRNTTVLLSLRFLNHPPLGHIGRSFGLFSILPLKDGTGV